MDRCFQKKEGGLDPVVGMAAAGAPAEDGRERALEILRDLLAAPGSFAVLELFFELTAVFFRAVPRPSEMQLRLLASLTTVGIQRFSMTPDLLGEIDQLRSLGLSGYDAACVGLARLLGGRWITFDREAHGAGRAPQAE